jgi:hypothetical protein
LALACNKNDNAQNNSETTKVTGTWRIISAINSNGPIYSFSNTDYPCISNNKLTLNEDSSASVTYTATDTCIISRTGRRPQILGIPSTNVPLTWRKTDNKIFLISTNGFIKTLDVSTINSKPVLILKETIDILAQTSLYTYGR